MTMRALRQTKSRNRLDQDTWADTSLLVIAYDTEGVGSVKTELLSFKVVFEAPPFFSWGVEAGPGQEIFEGDYPAVAVGVAEWETTEIADPRAELFYLGAFVWISVAAGFPYRLRFRLSFEGISMRNVEHFR